MEGYWSDVNENIIFVGVQIYICKPMLYQLFTLLFKGLGSARLYLFDQNKIEKPPQQYFYIIAISNIGFLIEYTFKYNLFPWCNTEFSAPWLQSSVPHDLQKSFRYADLLSILETVVLLNIFGTCHTFFFDSLMNKLVILNSKIFHTFFILYFWSNRYSHDEHKTLL